MQSPMLPVLITIDTEYSSGLYRSGLGREPGTNFDHAIACRTAGSKNSKGVGIHYQMDVFDRCGITGVFFVDPMPALVWGQEAVDAVVQPILERGHEVQLHLHTEWLALAAENPMGDSAGQNIKDFSLTQQIDLIGFAREKLMAAGAPTPTAFRAGNYGANDDTLRALAELGIKYDSSFAPGYADSCCAIDLTQGQCAPTERFGVTEWPIAAITAPRSQWRHGQITALSFREMRDAVLHAVETDWPAFVLVSHSFEFYDRVRQVENIAVRRRFEKFCEWLGTSEIADGRGFAALSNGNAKSNLRLMPHSLVRTTERLVEQFFANRLYG